MKVNTSRMTVQDALVLTQAGTSMNHGKFERELFDEAWDVVRAVKTNILEKCLKEANLCPHCGEPLEKQHAQ